MGFDLTLAGLVLLAGLRGWFKGFVLQAIRLAGLVACVYAADPVRDLVKPRVVGYLPTIRPELVDRLLWWSSAVLSYVVIVGLSTLAVKMYRRKPLGEPEPLRNDQFAGFLLGAAKGLVVVAFLTAGVQKHALSYLHSHPWVARQTAESRALRWNERYQPADRFWATPPVQHWVGHIQRMGLTGPSATSATEPVASANRPPHLSVSAVAPSLGLDTSDLDPDSAEIVESIKAEIRKLEQGPGSN